MGLSYRVLLNAALAGPAAYMGGKRQGETDKANRETANALKAAQMRNYEANIAADQALAAQRKAQTEHPELFRAPKSKTESEQYTAYYDSLVAAGKTPAQADAEARRRFGKNQEAPRGPTPGTPEYYSMIDKTEGIRDRHQTGRDTGEGGSQKALIDRREFMQSRISHYTDQGLTTEEATARANEEYDAADRASGPFRDVSGGYGGMSSTAKTMSRSIPTGGANAGKSGVKPTVTTSTEKQNPTQSTSPKRGATRPATDTELDEAIDAVGSDPAKVRAYLAKKNLTP